MLHCHFQAVLFCSFCECNLLFLMLMLLFAIPVAVFGTVRRFFFFVVLRTHANFHTNHICDWNFIDMCACVSWSVVRFSRNWFEWTAIFFSICSETRFSDKSRAIWIKMRSKSNKKMTTKNKKLSFFQEFSRHCLINPIPLICSLIANYPLFILSSESYTSQTLTNCGIYFILSFLFSHTQTLNLLFLWSHRT